MRSALVICPLGDGSQAVERLILGLTVGERLLLALQHAGIKRAAFIGDGPTPASSRAEIDVVPARELCAEGDEEILLLPADVVFDGKMLGPDSEIVDELPLRRINANKLDDIGNDPEMWLERLGRGAADSGKGFAIRVVGNASALRAERSLLLSMRKPTDGFISRNLNRYISLFVTRYLIRTGIRPNPLTFFIMLIGLAGSVLAALPEHWWALVLAGLFFQGQSVLDGCDGEIARLTYRFSLVGQWLDTIGDDLTNCFFCLGLAVGQARLLGVPWLYGLGALAFMVMASASAIMYVRIIKLGTGDLLAIPDTLNTGSARFTGVPGLVVKFLRLITKRDFFVLLIAIMVMVQLPLAAFVTFATGSVPGLLGVAVNEVRLRRMERGDQSIRSE